MSLRGKYSQNQTLKLIGTNIRLLREAKGFSQEKLAEIAGIHDRTVGKIERGELNFSVGILIKLCKALKEDPCAVFPKN